MVHLLLPSHSDASSFGDYLYMLKTPRWLLAALFTTHLIPLAHGNGPPAHGNGPPAQAPAPVKALLICGGCCHDYDSQKGLIKKGLEQSGHIEVTVVHQGGNGTSAEIELYKDPNWAEPYDVILHDECFADDKDRAWLARILAPHRAGKPAVMIHCAMHCYRVGNDDWFELCGVTSHGHGPHYPHEVRNVRPTHPIMEGFGPAWFNPAGELYRIAKFWDSATALGTAKDRQNGEDQVCVWTNDYRGTRVFGTTLGHHNETVDHPTFVRLLTRGTLWAAGKLDDNYLKEPQPQVVPVNLALQKTVTSSSEQRDQNNLSSMATDGNRGTRWCASGGDFPQQLEIDLETPRQITGTKILWESDGATYVYKILGSDNADSWQTLFDSSPTGVRGGDADHAFEADNVRFIKIEITAASPGSWASIREVQVHGTETQIIEPEILNQNQDRELLGDVKIPEGFDATVFAAPPAVNYPVYVAAATDGTVFVSSDKNGSLDREPRRGSVVRLVDLDGDGRADSSNLYVDNVDSPRGLVWDHDRLYLMHPPHLSAFIDDDGDGVSDRQEILVKNIAFDFKDRPADHTSNGVTLGVDGWLYLAIGDFGFMRAEGTDGRTLQFRGGGVVRVRPDGTGLQLYSRGTRNILEVALDPLLRGFTRDNTNDGGGWDTRLHHFTGLEDHGYPRTYINFGDEIIQPLADYGGGSGCGALYMDEPGMPPGFGDAIYTADWGRQQIFRHNVIDSGATVTADQSEFLGLPRATDLDVDASSHIYAASWKGATFTYADENVGFIVQLSPQNYSPRALPDFASASNENLVNLLRDPSHRRRLEAQRSLIRRCVSSPGESAANIGLLKQLALDNDTSLKSRVAAIFAIKQILGRDSTDLLTELARQPEITAWCVRALGDRWDQIDPAATETIIQGLASNAPRTALESIVAAARFGMEDQELADQLAPHVARWFASSDNVLRHTAIEASILMTAVDPSLDLISGPSSSLAARQAAFRVLQAIHQPHVIDALANLLDDPSSENSEFAFSALARLYHVEGEWKGNSWGTRPDTRGPYYQPETWQLSSRIGKLLNTHLENASNETAINLLSIMAKNRIDISDSLENWFASSSGKTLDTNTTLALLSKAGTLKPASLGYLESLAGTELPVNQRQQVNALLLNDDSPKSAASLVRSLSTAIKNQTAVQLSPLLKQLVDNRSLGKKLPQILAQRNDPATTDLAPAIMLLAIELQANKKPSPELTTAIDQLWSEQALVTRVMEFVMAANFREAEPLVQRALLDTRPQVADAAGVIAGHWNLASLNDYQGQKIKEIDPQAVLKQVAAMQGDANRGLTVFAALGCGKCHDVSPTEDLRGPYLPNVAKTYKREQLTEAVLLPSKSIAQGFLQNVFLMADGRVLSGFVTSEAELEISIRDKEGTLIKIPVEEIEHRSESKISVMPEGLADGVPPAALADLVSYLQSIGQ